jgi:hypothetical protein
MALPGCTEVKEVGDVAVQVGMRAVLHPLHYLEQAQPFCDSCLLWDA